MQCNKDESLKNHCRKLAKSNSHPHNKCEGLTVYMHPEFMEEGMQYYKPFLNA